MAPDVIEDNFNSTEPDPLNEPEVEIETTTTEQEPEVATPAGVQGIEGTPFKDQAALVEGYKNIQKLVSSKDGEMQRLQQQLQVAMQALQQMYGQPEKKEEPKLEGEAFWQSLSKEPTTVIGQIAKKQAEELFKNQFGKDFTHMKEVIQNIQRQQVVNSFLSNHPDFTEQDEEAMVHILQANPQLQALPNALELVYDSVVAQRYRAESAKKSKDEALSGPKSVAGLGGKKTSLPSQSKDKDPFDDVLDLDKSERELYNFKSKKA
jgi:hypothetical protein